MKFVTVVMAGTILALSAGVSGCSGDTPANTKPAAIAKASPTKAEAGVSPSAAEAAKAVFPVAPPPITKGPTVAPSSAKSLATEAAPTTRSASAKSSEASSASSMANSATSESVDASLVSPTYGTPGPSGSTIQPVSSGTPATGIVTGPKDALLAKAKVLSTHLLVTSLPYQNRTGQALYFDAYFPTNFKTSSTGPYVFVVHGGDWSEGAKEDVKPFAIALAEKGFVAIAPDYRLAPANPHPAQVNDLSDLMTHIEASPSMLFTTGTNYGVVGVGAGGHLASLVALSPSASGRLTCVANVFSQTDLTNLPTLDASIRQFLGVNYSSPKLIEVSPLYEITNSAASPQFYLSHGTADALVPHSQSVNFAAELQRNSLQVTLSSVQGGAHGYGEAQTKTTASDIAIFMKSCLAIQ
jgi:acetyl esterase/lipase